MKMVKDETKNVINDISKLNDGHNHYSESTGTEIEEAKQEQAKKDKAEKEKAEKEKADKVKAELDKIMKPDSKDDAEEEKDEGK